MTPDGSPTTPRPSESLQPMPLHMALQSHCNDTTQTPPKSPQSATAATPELSPADCRTLQKLLGETRTSSALASSSVNRQGDSLLSSDASEDEISGAGADDEVQSTEPQFEYGDEREEGYEDEDDSMELSDITEDEQDDDGMLNREDEDQSVLNNIDDSVYVLSDGDTIEDIMNTPGKTAPPAPEQDPSGVYTHDQSTPEDVREIKARHAELEQELENERLNQEHHEVAAVEDEPSFACSDEEEDDATDLSHNSEIRAIEAVQSKIGISLNEVEEEIVAELEACNFEPADRRASRLFSPASKFVHHGNSSSSHDLFSIEEPSLLPSSGSKHRVSTPNASIPDTPFTKTLRYFKQYKGKENSPSKSRRNASLPEEIAELVQEAAEEEEEDLGKYREIDLAPMESLAEISELVGGENDLWGCSGVDLASTKAAVEQDLITLDSPVESNTSPDQTSLRYKSFGFNVPALETRTQQSHMHSPQCPSLMLKQDEDYNADAETSRQPITPSPRPLSRLVEQDEDEDADTEASDTAPGVAGKSVIVRVEDPTFITIIGMLPKAMFWTAIAPAARLGNMAYDSMLQKLTRLELE